MHILLRINRKLPARFAKFDESLGKPYDILKVDIGVYHAVRHQQRVLETFRVVDRRRLTVGQRIVVREI